MARSSATTNTSTASPAPVAEVVVEPDTNSAEAAPVKAPTEKKGATK